MTIPGAAAVLLLAVGLALGVLLAALAPAALARRRGRSRPSAPPPTDFPDDDLPDFLATPPGTAGARAIPRSGWAALSPLPPPPSAPTTAGVAPSRVALVSGLVALVLLTAFVAVLAPAGRPTQAEAPEHRVAARSPFPLPAVPTAPAPGDPGAGRLAAADVPVGPRGTAADLTFTGIVLERRAVGVTAAYPHVRITDDGSTTLAHVELVTFNCLTDAAPPDPVAAGCSRVVPEYAELATPALQVLRAPGGRLALRGHFPTYLQPNGTPAAWTGEVYDLRLDVSPSTAAHPGTDVPATGFLQLGADRAGTTALSVVRSGR
jgi:hypothetical protein